MSDTFDSPQKAEPEFAPPVDVDGMGVTYLTVAPLIHIHYPIGDVEAAAFGYTVHEMCCHSCGEAHSVYLDFTLVRPEDTGIATADADRAFEVFRAFREEHLKCAQLMPWTDRIRLRMKVAMAPHLGNMAELRRTFCPVLRTQRKVTDFRTRVVSVN